MKYYSNLLKFQSWISRSFIIRLIVAGIVGLPVSGQQIIINPGAYLKNAGTAYLNFNDVSLINDGSYSKGTETMTFSGTTSKTISGNSNTGIYNLLVTNTGGIISQLGLLSTNNLSIESGSRFTTDPAKALSITGSTNLGSAGCLILKSDATGTASFIDNGTISGSGTARIERYITPYTVVSDLKFHFLSSPVINQPIESEFMNLASSDITDFYQWNEPSDVWISYRKGSSGEDFHLKNPSFTESTFLTGKGYMVAYPSTITKNFTGIPNTGNVAITCYHEGQGWNIIGNPYPSSIDWDIVSSTLGDGMDNALYYYDNDLPGYKYYTYFSGGLGGATQFIAPMQGFIVHAKNIGTKTVTLSNTARTHTGQNVFYKDSPLTANLLDLKVEGNDKVDYARICFYDEATENFDGDFDAFKLFSYNSSASEIYSLTPDLTSLAINTLPVAIMDGGFVLVHFKVGTSGQYMLTAENLETFSANVYIFLEDKVTGTFHKFNDNPCYSFSASAQEPSDRFVLHFTDATSVSDPSFSESSIAWYGNGSLYVSTVKDKTDVAVFNLQGQILYHYQLKNHGLHIQSVKLPAGVYFARLTIDRQSQTEKIIVQ